VEESGVFLYIFTQCPGNPGMITFIGEYTCKVDAKGRIMLPSAFKKQLPAGSHEKFVVKPDVFEKCLVLYPIQEWERQNRIIRRNTNPYNKEHSRFLRMFYQGTAELVLDASNRILIPKRLMEFSGANNEVLLAGQFGKIEVWSPELYGKVSGDTADFASLAEKILGGAINDLEAE
jgi:MraZ protein